MSLAAANSGCGSMRGPVTAMMPGRQTLGAEKPFGSDQPAEIARGSSRTAGPRAATTIFEPVLKPLPE